MALRFNRTPVGEAALASGADMHRRQFKKHRRKVKGVTWENPGKRWVVRVTAPNAEARTRTLVPISHHGGSIDKARRAAEAIAGEIRAGTYVAPPKRSAKYRSGVTGVYWHNRLMRWTIKVTAPNAEAATQTSVPIMRYGMDIVKTRQAAEEIAGKIAAGTYIETATKAKPGRRSRAVQGRAAAVKTQPDDGLIDWAAFPSSETQQGMERIQINAWQTLNVSTVTRTVIEVDGEGGTKIVADIIRDMDAAFIENQRQQTYNPDLEKRFPIRAPGNPEHVHALYADPNDPTRVARGVAIQGVELYKTVSISEKALWSYARADGTPYRDKTRYIEDLKASIAAEVQATIEGREPPSSNCIIIKPIETREQCDSVEEYRATKGQLGAFLESYAREKQPTLRNARIGCLFAAAKLENEEDVQAYIERTGETFGYEIIKDYAARARIRGKKREILWAPHGGGNMAQYFNSSFRKKTINGEDFLVPDKEAVTAVLTPITLNLKDKDGMERKEFLLGVSLIKTIQEGKQPKLDYGPEYRIALNSNLSEAGKMSSGIKSEPPHDEDDLMTDGQQ